MSTKSSPFLGLVNAPDIPASLPWYNTEQPLSLKNLQGRFVLLKFWTSGCINCLHTFDEVDQLRKKFHQDLVVIGVHTGKFTYERSGFLLRNAIQKIGIDFPVVDDFKYQIWESYTIQAWPSFILIAPNGKIIGQCSGEGSYKLLNQILSRAISYWVENKKYSPFDSQNEIQYGFHTNPFFSVQKKSGEVISGLNYPTGLATDHLKKRLFISDTGNHRILMIEESGVVLNAIGGLDAGFKDGEFSEVKFRKPRGIFFDEAHDCLFIADEGNHAIRRVSLAHRKVDTIAGNGFQSVVKPVQGRAEEIGLNSPWDIVKKGGSLIMAMAGSHQLWEFNLDSNSLQLLAGSGREELYDTRAEHAALAQPSSLLFHKDRLLFLDTESSALRSLELNDSADFEFKGVKHVKTLIGKGLFHFGDKDGEFDDALLQHPRGLAQHHEFVYLSDTYNHKIKRLDLRLRKIETLIDNTEYDLLMSEPEGIAISFPHLFIADSNHHRILCYNLETKTFRKVELIMQELNT
ncbi:MAG: thioredoxin-like domain-containing protein [Chloroherpetonaceae bacterium]|nr:thioredoxin-like domain-containing protein [Chloroherpetonaceae bacterium]